MGVSPLSFLLPFLLNLGSTAETTQTGDRVSFVVVRVCVPMANKETVTHYALVVIH